MLTSERPRVSVIIATYNMRHLILKTIDSIKDQNFPNIEIVVYDDCSSDGTDLIKWDTLDVKYIRGDVNVGVGEAFNRGIDASQGDYIILMCADDLFTTREYIPDVVRIFDVNPPVGHVTRWYYQFIDGYPGPVRAWRGDDRILLANNPSGLAFRRSALIQAKARCSNHMFIETSHLVGVLHYYGWNAALLQYDAVAVRVHRSTSTNRAYWRKRRVSSPVLDWARCGCAAIAKDYVSFIQIKNGLGIKEVWEEIVNFAIVRPVNLVTPQYYFWALVALLIPRQILVHLPAFYRHRIGRYLTREIRRP